MCVCIQKCSRQAGKWTSLSLCKLVLVFIVVLFSDATQYGGYVAVWLLEASFILHHLANPYANQRQHRQGGY